MGVRACCATHPIFYHKHFNWPYLCSIACRRNSKIGKVPAYLKLNLLAVSLFGGKKKKKKDATVKAGCCEQEHAFESSCFLGYV